MKSFMQCFQEIDRQTSTMLKFGQTFSEWLLESDGLGRKERLVIYDFDGTIFNSPDREVGEEIYIRETGMGLPFSGWWGRIESLSPPIVPNKPGEEWLIRSTIENYKEEVARRGIDTELVLMTGRPFKMKGRVVEICDYFGLGFDYYFFRGQSGSKGSDTLEIKANFIINDLVHDGLKVLEIWEDRPEHIIGFANFAKELKLRFPHIEKVIIHDATSSGMKEIV